MPAPLSPVTSNRASTLALLFFCSLLCACNGAQSPSESLEVATVGLHAGTLDATGTRAVVGSLYQGGSFWQLDSRARKFNWNHNRDEFTTIIHTAFASNSDYALTADASALVLWNTRTGEALRYWSAPGEILDAALGPMGNIALLGLSDHTAVLFDIQRGGILYRLPSDNRVRSVDLSRNGRMAITGSEDATATLWDTSTGKQLRKIKHNDDVQLVRLSPDGNLALSVSKYDKALIWQTRDGKALGELPLNAEHLKRGMMFSAARFSDDNTKLLTGRPDQMVQLWRLPDLVEVERWRLPKRKRWKPGGAAVLDVSFDAQVSRFHAIASNGFIHTLASAPTAP